MLRVFEDFLLFKASGSSGRTVEAYCDILERFETWLAGRDPLAMDQDDLLVFTGPYAHKVLHLAPKSRTPYVACIRQFYLWATTVRRLIHINPAESVPYPRSGKRLPRVLSLENAERLMWAPDYSTFMGVRDSAMLAVLMGCGLRVAGLAALNQGALVTQQVNGMARLSLRVIEKGNRERLLPVPLEADMLLRVYLEHPDLAKIDRTTEDGDQVLFVTTRNRRCPAHEYYGERRRWSPRGIFAMLRRHGLRAGIPEDQLHPHALRHLFGTELAESDVDILIRQQFLGHRDPRSTEIYEHLAVRKLVGTMDRANPLGKIDTPATRLLKELSNVPKASPKSR